MSQDPDEEAPKPAAAGAVEGPSDPTDELLAALDGPPTPSPDGQYQKRAEAAEARVAEVLSAYRKLKVENEGFRDRVTRDVQRQAERHNEKLLLKFIEVLDNLDRALEAADQSYAGNPFIEGLILVRTQLLQILQKEGLERIPVLGLPYDPGLSEAVGTQVVTDPDHEHIVVRELLRGYKLHGRVARPSRVIIGIYRDDAVKAKRTEEGMIGADEVLEGELDPAADTLRLDEETLRQIFGPDEPDAEPK